MKKPVKRKTFEIANPEKTGSVYNQSAAPQIQEKK
jgi:hypothetical protein